jgi:hypothetical protein
MHTSFDRLEPIADAEFGHFQRFIFEVAGGTMSDAKKTLVSGRLAKRLAHYRPTACGAYFKMLAAEREGDEAQIAVNLLSTNATYFFRETKHFELLAKLNDINRALQALAPSTYRKPRGCPMPKSASMVDVFMFPALERGGCEAVGCKNGDAAERLPPPHRPRKPRRATTASHPLHPRPCRAPPLPLSLKVQR